jgi:HEAT repeat protein
MLLFHLDRAPHPTLIVALWALFFVGAASRASAKEFTINLERATAQADLIVTVRLAEMSEAKVVHGGKMVEVTQQFRFTPVRVLKGVFARDALLLTGNDLGIYRFAEDSHRLEEGQMLLLFLGRRGPGFFNCNEAAELDQSLPRLASADDPLVPAVETLIAVSQERDRSKKVGLLLDGLRASKGRDAISLLASLERRAILAAQTPGVVDVVARPLGNASPRVREAAARALGAILRADYLVQHDLRTMAAEELTQALATAGPNVDARVALFDALGSAGADVRSNAKALEWLKIDQPASTFAERSARMRAIGRAALRPQSNDLSAAIDSLPLDAPGVMESAAVDALVRLDPEKAVERISERIERKTAAGLGLSAEIQALGDLPPALAAPVLLKFQDKDLSTPDQYQLAAACRKVAQPPLVPLLSRMLDPRRDDTRAMALAALRAIDTDAAAKAVWPHLGEEGNLGTKLALAEFLGRHGYRDGYVFAIEHMSEPNLLDEAIDALAAIREPKAVAELRKIWDTSHDVAWNAAAIRALGRLGQADLAERFLAVAQDLRNPLAPYALIALADIGEPKVLAPLREALSSRSDDIVIAAIRATGKLLASGRVHDDDARDRLAALLADPDASQSVRTEALNALVALDDPRLDAALAIAIRDGRIEDSTLLQRVEERITERRERLAQR